jgi:hypothetical protein
MANPQDMFSPILGDKRGTSPPWGDVLRALHELGPDQGDLRSLCRNLKVKLPERLRADKGVVERELEDMRREHLVRRQTGRGDNRWVITSKRRHFAGLPLIQIDAQLRCADKAAAHYAGLQSRPRESASISLTPTLPPPPDPVGRAW